MMHTREFSPSPSHPQNDQPSPSLSLFWLGAPRIECGQTPVEFKARKAIALLAYLSITNKPHTRDELSTLFWPESEQSRARAALRNILWLIKKAIGEAWLDSDREIIYLNRSDSLWVDVDHFYRRVAECKQHDHPAERVCPACLAPLTEAATVYQADFLAGFTLRNSEEFDDWQQFESERLRHELGQVLEKLAWGYCQRGERDLASAYARRWLELDPLHEPAHRLLMELYHQAGQWAAATRQYEDCTQVLQRELGVEPQAETQQLYQAILKDRKISQAPSQSRSDSPARAQPPTAGWHNLPAPLTSFIGRESEIAQVKQWLVPGCGDQTTPEPTSGARLLTLLGMGGIGKTRLALQVAWEVVSAFPDGVWWVELAAITEPALVPQAVAVALGVREESQRSLMSLLVYYLSGKAALLLLDNCEHLVQTCSQFAEALLRACPRLRILATSREALGVAGEFVFNVPPLPLPSLEPLPPVESLAEYKAIRLFLERVVAVQPSFGLTEQNASFVAQVCSQLDGIPLATELAAARVRAMTVEQIAARLNDRFRLLTGGSRTALPHQQTLRASLDWSYDLLAEAERVLLRRLSVFAGGWTLEAAEQVCGDGEQEKAGLDSLQVLDSLTQLVNKSLVVFEEKNGEARYRLLETIRQYGRERLLESGEGEQVRSRHLAFFLSWAEQVEPRLWGEQQKVWLDRMEQEHDNLRAALAWAQAQESAAGTQAGLRLAVAMGTFWLVRGHWVEGTKWLTSLLNRSAPSGHTLARANALNLAGELANKQGNHKLACSFHTKGLEMGRELGDERVEAFAQMGLGNGKEVKDIAQAISFFEQSLALFRRLDDQPGLARALGAAATGAFLNRQYERADSLWQESLAICQAIGHQMGIAGTLVGIGMLALLQSQYARARLALEESVAIYRVFDDKAGLLEALYFLGGATRYAGDYEDAVAYYEESLQLSKLMGGKRRSAGLLRNLGHTLCRLGEYEKARALFKESILASQALDSQEAVLSCLMGLAGVMGLRGQALAAAQLMGAAELLLDTLGITINPVNRAEHDYYVANVRSQLEPAAFAAAWAKGKGQTMTMEQAIAYALRAETE